MSAWGASLPTYYTPYVLSPPLSPSTLLYGRILFALLAWHMQKQPKKRCLIRMVG